MSRKREFDDIYAIPSSDCETRFYKRTKPYSTPVACNASSKPVQTENSEGVYDQLRFDRREPLKQENTIKQEETIKRIKLLICICLVLGTVLCIAVTALITIVAVPKDGVDGGWTLWENWVSCSNSCGIGVQSRARTCSNPLPSLTGKYCDGSPVEVKTCNRDSCTSVNGGWTSWGSWRSCSEICGIGVQSRARTCSNPLPSPNEKSCDGSPLEVKTCNRDPCTRVNGGWNSWGSWRSCSESCGSGVQSRARTCSNPLPSPTGKYCDESPVEVKTCNKQPCTDGVWSLWENWGICSRGVRTRSRSCTYPTSSLTDRPCAGAYTDFSTCNLTTCPGHNVAFTAYDIHVYGNSSTKYAALLFQRTYINIGNAYSTTTGKFTCHVPGVYHFVVTLTKSYQDIYSVSAYLKINGNNKLTMYYFPKHDDSNEVGVTLLTGAGTFHLNRRDVVYVDGVSNYFMNDKFSYFTGFLVTPDE